MTLRSNKQKMKYSLFVSSTQEYELDEDGNIVYVEVDGEMIPVKVGETEEHYATPVDFKACITSELNELHMKAFGVDQSSIYSTLTCKKGYLPLAYRMFCLQSHYRKPLEFSFEVLENVTTAYKKLVKKIAELKDDGAVDQKIFDEYKNIVLSKKLPKALINR